MARREEVNDLPSIAEILRHYGASLRATHGKLISVALSTQTLTKVVQPISIKISSSALPVVCRETVYK
jgi:hypothetical protein